MVMRILLYNFRQPEEPGTGGAGMYLNRLAQALDARGYTIITLSSGWEYGPKGARPYLRKYTDRYERAIIVNSPAIAPARLSLSDPGTYVNSNGLNVLVAELASALGEIDVFHFHNIEGLTHQFISLLRQTYGRATFIYTAHNYNLICPLVTLWFQNRIVCPDFDEGHNCLICQSHEIDPAREKLKRWMSQRLSPPKY